MTDVKVTQKDAKIGIQAFMVLDTFVLLLVWSGSITLTALLMTRFGFWPKTGPANVGFRDAWEWGQSASTGVLIYNVVYVLVLCALKLLIPNPREGRYAMRPGETPNRQLIWSALIAVLTKAHYEAPFPAFLVHTLSSLPPLRWIVGPTLGPRTASCNVTRPILGDPHMTTIGRNVVIGFGAQITGHVQKRDEVILARTKIDDEVLVGANSLIFGGCHVKRGATILSGAIVRPFTVIGEYEVWGGMPAVKLRDGRDASAAAAS